MARFMVPPLNARNSGDGGMQDAESRIEQRWWPRRMLNRLEVNKAVFFSVAARGWQFASGPITIALLASYFTPAMRGYYAAFSSILAMQLFFELSLHVVIINLASHEWSGLRLEANGRISGDPECLSRLVHLCRLTFRWYAIAGLLFAVTVTVGGAVYLSQGTLAFSEWLMPWSCLVLLTAGLLLVLPFTSLLEGCDQLAVVNRFRVLQAVTGSLIVWILIMSNCGLWAVVGSAAVRLFWEIWLVAVRYRNFFQSLAGAVRNSMLDWRVEVWPLQWRLAIQGVVGYFAMQLFTLVIFQYHGDAAGGRMGLTWNILYSLQAGAFAWVETRRPIFGQLVARGEFDQLDRVFRRLVMISLAVLVISVTLFVGTVLVVNEVDHAFARNLAATLLEPRPLVVLALAIIATHLPRCQNIYVRAHKRDPFLVPGVLTNACIGGCVWYFGRVRGPMGAAVAYLAVVALIQFPVWTVIWQRSRREWHSNPEKPAF